MGRKIPAINFPTFLETKSKKGGGNPPHAYAYASVRSSISKFFLELDTTVRHLCLRRCCLLAIIGVVLNTTVCDLCHWFTPKVVGVFNSVPLVGFCVPLTMRCLFYHYADHLSSCLFLDLKLIHLI